MMKYVKKTGVIGILLLSINLQCASVQKIEKTSPMNISNTYFNTWISGIQGGGNGFDLYIEVEKKDNIQLDYAYFKEKKIKLEYIPENHMYRGHYTYPPKKDLIMSDNPQEEYKNQLPTIEEKIPFDLKENEAIISYTNKGKQGFFRLENIKEKESQSYPRQNRQ